METTPRSFGHYPFRYVCSIQPERDAAGHIRQYMPQSQYKNLESLPLHKHGRGPFCRFRIPRAFSEEGVYILVVDELPHYIGECVNLSSRFNMGYGQISPRNCYERGQPTNCKINHFVLQNTNRGSQIALWFHQTSSRKVIEDELIGRLKPFWNTQGVS